MSCGLIMPGVRVDAHFVASTELISKSRFQVFPSCLSQLRTNKKQNLKFSLSLLWEILIFQIYFHQISS